MCPFYNAQLFEITGAARGVFTHSQSSCHIAKVVLTIRRDSRQIPLAARHHTFPHRGFLHWRFAYAGPGVRRATVMGPASANLHRSGQSGMALGETMTYFLITSLKPTVIRAERGN